MIAGIKKIMTESDNDNHTNADERPSRTLDVKEWPDISIGKWKDWGFSVSEVYRTLKYNFITQRTTSTVKEISPDNPAFIFEGRLFRIDESNERYLEKWSWAANFLALVFFAGLLYSVKINYGILAVFLFFCMYLTLEGFLPFMMSNLAPEKKSEKLEIPWSDLARVVYVSKPGVILLGWREGEKDTGLAMRFHPDNGKQIIERLRAGVDENVTILEVDNVNLGNPPGDFG